MTNKFNYYTQVVDTGLYTCRANNEAGQADLSYQVDVQGRNVADVTYTLSMPEKQPEAIRALNYSLKLLWQWHECVNVMVSMYVNSLNISNFHVNV